VVYAYPAATLAQPPHRLVDLGWLWHHVKGKRLAQQRSVVAAHPRAFELNPQLPQGHAPKNRQAASNRRHRPFSYSRLHYLFTSYRRFATSQASSSGSHVQLKRGIVLQIR
jgi:hypothetical protein